MKRALITGGSGDIGSTICRTLAARSIHTIVHANQSIDRARQVVADIIANGGSAEVVSFDVRNEQQCQEEISQLLESGPIQILVNNAGIYKDAPMAGMNSKAWNDVIDVSLHGFYHVTRPLLMPMISSRWGRIVSITSVSGVKGNRGQSNYAAAKAGVLGASKSLALELASRGITVNCVAPGVIEGKINALEFSKEDIKRIVPMKRAGTVDEVADLVDFLVSDKAGYISGQSISIDGAMS
ncbi:MAG: 3-oxoacyl-ACP reductase FabG [Gammaproteobacteria bacterium]